MNINNKEFYKYKNSKRKTRENVGQLLNGAWELVTNDTEKDKVLNAFLGSVFTSMIVLQKSKAPETRGEVLKKEELPSVEEG